MCPQCLQELACALRGFENGTAVAISPRMEGSQGTLTGRWLFTPLPKWETQPDSFYSLRKSQIYLRLVFRLPDADVKFCMRHDLLPPERLRKRELVAWVAGARAVTGRG